jgi:hypothetical protein
MILFLGGMAVVVGVKVHTLYRTETLLGLAKVDKTASKKPFTYGLRKVSVNVGRDAAYTLILLKAVEHRHVRAIQRQLHALPCDQRSRSKGCQKSIGCHRWQHSVVRACPSWERASGFNSGYQLDWNQSSIRLHHGPHHGINAPPLQIFVCTANLIHHIPFPVSTSTNHQRSSSSLYYGFPVSTSVFVVANILYF